MVVMFMLMVKILTPKTTVLGNEEMTPLGGDWVTRVAPSWMGLLAYKRGSRSRSLTLPPCKDTARRFQLWTRRRALTRKAIELVSRISDFPVSRPVRNKYLLLISHGQWCLLKQPQQVNTGFLNIRDPLGKCSRYNSCFSWTLDYRH